MIQKTASFLLAALLVLSGSARAQTSSPAAPSTDQKPPDGDDHVIRQIIPFLQGSYLFKSNQTAVLFEAAIFPHLMLWQNFDSLIDARRPNVRALSWWRQYWAISITPGVRLKMSDEFSEPIRTPSYMPRVDVQKMTALGRSNTVARRKTTLDLLELHFALEHHSNGQNGCLFTEQHLEHPDDPVLAKCVPEFKDESAPGTVNKHDGSFSTNQFRVGVNLRRTHVSDDGIGMRHYGAGIEYQGQIFTDPDLKPFYSQRRLNANASIAWRVPPVCASRMGLAVQVITALDHPVPSVNRVSGSAEWSCFPSNKGGFGGFVRGYWGQDPYNLGFLDNISRVEFGLTFNQDGLFRFRPSK